jgi:hypothetical protein
MASGFYCRSACAVCASLSMAASAANTSSCCFWRSSSSLKLVQGERIAQQERVGLDIGPNELRTPE